MRSHRNFDYDWRSQENFKFKKKKIEGVIIERIKLSTYHQI